MKSEMNKIFKALIIFFVASVFLSCGSPVNYTPNESVGSDLTFNLSLRDNISRSAVPVAFDSGVFYKLTISNSSETKVRESKYQKTLSFTINAPDWTGSSVARLYMYCPESSQIDPVTEEIKTEEYGNLTVAMEGHKDFTLSSSQRTFDFTINLAISHETNGSIKLPVTVGTTGCQSCYIVKNSVVGDPTNYISGIIQAGNIIANDVVPFSEPVTFYFFTTATPNTNLTQAKIVYTDSLTVFAGTETKIWINGTVQPSLDLTSLIYTTFYVDGTNGNNSNSGSSLKPVKTIAAALNLCTDSATPGQIGGTIYLKNNPADSGNIQISKSVKILKTQSAGEITLSKGVSVSGNKTLELEGVNVKNQGTNTTAIALGSGAKLTLKDLGVSNCKNGIEGSSVEVNFKSGVTVSSCSGTGLLLGTSSVLKVQDTAVTSGDSSDLDFITGNGIDIHNKAGEYIRINKDSVTDDSGSFLKSLLNNDTTETTRTIYIGKSNDDAITWDLGGTASPTQDSSATRTYTLCPTKSNGRITIQRNANCPSDSTFPLIIYPSNDSDPNSGKLVFKNVTFKNAKNTSDGGAVLIKTGTVDFDNCVFINNEASSGGALAIEGENTTVNLEDCTFGGDLSSDGNKAKLNGGAIFCEGSLAIKGSGNTFRNNKACIVSPNDGVRGGGAIFLASHGNCTMDGGVIDSNSVSSPGTGTAVIVGGSIAMQGSNTSFTLNQGHIKNGSLPATGSRYGQDVFVEEGSFILATSLTDSFISNTKNPGEAGEIYIYKGSGLGGLKDNTASAIPGDSPLLDKITLKNSSGDDVGGMEVILEGTSDSFIRINNPKSSEFYNALSKTNSFGGGTTIYIGKTDDTNQEYDCGSSSTAIICYNIKPGSSPVTITPTASESLSKNKILIKSSLDLQKNSYTFKNCQITGTGKNLKLSNATYQSLTLDNSTVTACDGVEIDGSGNTLVYKNDTVISDNTCPIVLKNGALIKKDSTVPNISSNDSYKGYLGYIKLQTAGGSFSSSQFFTSDSSSFISRFCFLPPDNISAAYTVTDANEVQMLTASDDNNPMIYYILTETVPAENKTVTISNQFELEQLRKWVNAETSQVLKKVTFELSNDIVLKGKWIPIGTAGGGNNGGAFGGVFEGNNHVISGLDVDYDTSIGIQYPALFQKIYGDSTSFINTSNKNAIIQNLTVTGKSQCAGIVGYAGRAFIINCVNEVEVTTPSTGVSAAAGICANNVGSIINNCTNKGKITGTSNVGGIVGQSTGGSSPVPIYKCLNNGIITGSSNVGGIAGTYSNAINSCKNTGSVTATGGYAGGIVGTFSGTNNNRTALRNIMNVWNTGDVTASNYAGGIAGFIRNGTAGDSSHCEVINAAHSGGKIIVTANSEKKVGYIYGGMVQVTTPTFFGDGPLFYERVSGSDVMGSSPVCGMGNYPYISTDLNGDGSVDNDDLLVEHATELISGNSAVDKLNIWADNASSGTGYDLTGFGSQYRPAKWQASTWPWQ